MKILILAGGKGKRLWPLIDPPKQFRRFGGNHSLLQKTLMRFLQRFEPASLHVITGRAYAEIARTQCSAVHPGLERQLILEPASRNTAPAIAHALSCLEGTLGKRCQQITSSYSIRSNTQKSMYLLGLMVFLV